MASLGVAVEAASGYVGGAIGSASIAFSNTLAIAGSSTLNSIGNYAVEGGQGDIYTSFGGFSINWSQGDVGYLGEKGNSTLENVGYGVGALANIPDVLAGVKPGDVELRTENDPNYYKTTDANGNPVPQKDLIGHSQILDENGNPKIDWGLLKP